jgi:hypothetical protein
MSRRRLSLAVALLATVLISSTVSPGLASADATPRVSIVSDSILTAVTWSNDPAQAALGAGLDLQIDAGVCRRLNGESCEFNGSHVPTTLSVINSWLYQLGSVVVIVDGYNDIPTNFADDVELTLDTLRDHAVSHVLWVNLHEIRPEFASKNAVLRAAAQRHPELRVLDWNSFSAAHPDWYQTDGIHLVPAGGLGIAAWLRQAIGDALAGAPAPPAAPAPPPAPSSPDLAVPAHQSVRGHVGVPMARQLRAGAAPALLRWRATSPVLRRAGLHLSAAGKLSGTPARAGTFAVPLVVSDVGGATARVTVSLAVAPRA